MKIRIKIIVLSTIALLHFTSCESMLDINSISEITTENYWKNENDVKGYMAGIYNNFRSTYNTTLYGEDRGDALTVGAVGGVSNAWKNQMTVTDGYNWLTFYELIHHCNMLIKYAPDVPFVNDNDKKRYLAEAYFFRAKAYLLLIQTWGDTPIVTDPTESYNQKRPARTSASEVMSLILTDINESLTLFPESTIRNKNNVSKPAAYCLQAEALAWKYKVLKSNDSADISAALTAIEEVEKSGVKLMTEYAEIFDYKKKKNEEIILSLHLQKDEYAGMYASRTSTAVIYVNTAVNREDIPYTKSGNALHNYAPSKELKAALSVYPNDKRKKVAYIDALKADGSVILTSQNKFRGNVYTDDRYFDDDIIMYRLADILLLKAELLADQGGASVNLAIQELNKVRERAGIGAYTGDSDQESVQREILEERGRELCFELKRWPDIMRAHHAGVINVYSYVPNLMGLSKKTPLYLPIQQAMIDINTNLKQTDGY